jgi:hypothetical protein
LDAMRPGTGPPLRSGWASAYRTQASGQDTADGQVDDDHQALSPGPLGGLFPGRSAGQYPGWPFGSTALAERVILVVVVEPAAVPAGSHCADVSLGSRPASRRVGSSWMVSRPGPAAGRGGPW